MLHGEMMAAAEARAAWQRADNRCFVQGDAKRAPKLACCQSSATSMKQIDSGYIGATDSPDQSAIGFMLQNQSTAFPDLRADTRGWLQMQPNHEYYQKGLPHKQLNTKEFDVKMAQYLNSMSLDCSPLHSNDVPHKMHPMGLDFLDKRDFAAAEKDFRGLEPQKNVGEFLELLETKENYMFVEMDSGFPASGRQKEEFSPDSPWTSERKNGTWWQTTDKDELASLVSQKSLDFIMNCDLPPPQGMHTREYPNRHTGPQGDDLSTLDLKPGACFSDQSSPDSARAVSSPAGFRQGRCFSDSNKSSSYSTSASTQTQHLEHDLSKIELLEALRHSQTRARDAEKAAKEAYAEREHIVTLFFKQASQLFAYKQWFQILQLETLCHQIKQDNNGLISTANQWFPCKRGKTKNSFRKAAGKERNDLSSCSVAFVLGLSLVGAGLLLGWTVGWLLPL